MRILKQNDKSTQGGWGATLLGHSAVTTIGQKGCMWVCFTMVVNELLGEFQRPDDFQRYILQKDPHAFEGVTFYIERSARAVGLVALEAERLRSHVGDPRLPDRVLAGLGIELAAFKNQHPPLHVNTTPPAKEGGVGFPGLCILHVDHDGDPSDGEHFVVAYAWFNGQIRCADPATGKDVFLDDRTLTGVSVWGDVPKTYRVVGTIPIRRAA